MRTLHFTRRRWLQTGLALGSLPALPAARACEFFSTTLRVTHPWTRASVAGATTAVECMTFDEVLQDDRLIGVETPLAERAEIGGGAANAGLDLSIPAGQTTALTESGVHLRLLALRQPLLISRTYPLRLVFEKGGAIDADLSVDYASARDGRLAEMPGVRHATVIAAA